MPFKISKRQKNKLYYSQHKEKINATSKSFYETNKRKVTEQSMLHQQEIALINPAKFRKIVAQRASRYYQNHSQTDIVRQKVVRYRKQNPHKLRAATRLSVYRNLV